MCFAIDANWQIVAQIFYGRNNKDGAQGVCHSTGCIEKNSDWQTFDAAVKPNCDRYRYIKHLVSIVHSKYR